MNHHLTQVQRCQIEGSLSIGMNQKQIAKLLNVSESTVSRELKRNGCRWGYSALIAEQDAQARRSKASKKPKVLTSAVREIVEEKLRERWSPEQISGRLRHENPAIKISTTTIYRHIHSVVYRRDPLKAYLRHQGKKYRYSKGKTAGVGLIKNRVDISERPKIVEEKNRVGDFEGDTIIGSAHQGVLLTLVDRKSRYVFIQKLEGKYADQIPIAIKQCFDQILGLKPKTVTFDNGTEFAHHEAITRLTGAQCYFARPYCAWERGVNEHHNGLIRQYFPKGSALNILSEEEIKFVEDALNNRPRKVLQFKTPKEVLQEDTRNQEIASQL